jgi:hypothetical protein
MSIDSHAEGEKSRMNLSRFLGVLSATIVIAIFLFTPITSESSPRMAQPYVGQPLSNQTITRIIHDNEPAINIGINGKKIHGVSVPSDPAHPAYAVLSSALDVTMSCNSMLRMIIDTKRAALFRNADFVELKFERPADLTLAISAGKSLPFSNILIPLSNQNTEISVYYSTDHRDSPAFALRWIDPNMKALAALRQSVEQLAGASQR